MDRPPVVRPSVDRPSVDRPWVARPLSKSYPGSLVHLLTDDLVTIDLLQFQWRAIGLLT